MYKRSAQGWLKHLDFMLLDMLAIQISLALAYCSRNGISWYFQDSMYLQIAYILFLDGVCICFLNQSYREILRRSWFSEIIAVLKHMTLIILLAMFCEFLLSYRNAYSRQIILVTWGLGIILMFLFRSVRKKAICNKMKENEGNSSLVFVTVNDLAEETVQHIKKNNYGHLKITGVILLDQDEEAKKEVDGIPVVANGKMFYNYVQYNWVDEVMVRLPEGYPDSEKKKIMQDILEMGITAHEVLEWPNVKGCVQTLEKVAGYSVIAHSLAMTTPKQMFMKRCLDLAGGLVGCLLTGILCIFMAPAIYIKSPGPIFYSQWRIGRNGKKFKLYKFRSMYPDADQRKKELESQNNVKDGYMFKMENDPRIIKGIGHFIRKTSLDEFPQFFNVLKGDMSLVGTRPPTVDEWEKYQLHHRKRLAFKPGITGMWQVSGRSEITDFEKVVEMDTEYILQWSMALDFQLLWKTVMVVLKGEGAK